jgi:hypothetical protein
MLLLKRKGPSSARQAVQEFERPEAADNNSPNEPTIKRQT